MLYANVIHDVNRAAGRNGMGAVMGSKKLKAVAVRGTMELPMVDRDRVVEVTKWLGQNYKKRMGWATEGIGRSFRSLTKSQATKTVQAKKTSCGGMRVQRTRANPSRGLSSESDSNPPRRAAGPRGRRA